MSVAASPTVRSERDRAAAARLADQIIFEGFRA